MFSKTDRFVDRRRRMSTTLVTIQILLEKVWVDVPHRQRYDRRRRK